MLINLFMTGEPMSELKAGHGIDYNRIFMSGGDYLRSCGPIRLTTIFILLATVANIHVQQKCLIVKLNN